MFSKLWNSFEAEFIGQSKEFHPAKNTMYYGRMTDAQLEAMRQRNEEAIQKRIEEMGSNWVLHPSHHVQRLDHVSK